MQPHLIRGLVIAAVGFVAIGFSWALPSPSQQNAIRNDCEMDYPKYCSGVSTRVDGLVALPAKEFGQTVAGVSQGGRSHKVGAAVSPMVIQREAAEQRF